MHLADSDNFGETKGKCCDMSWNLVQP